MRENYTYRGVKGMRDVFPADSRRYLWLEQKAREMFRAYGLGEIRTPIVEPSALFERGIGTGTDIVNKEMFYVPAKDEEDARAGTRMVLRPEATASVARAYVEHEIHKTAPGMQRYYYLGPMFRYERPQKGRLRQFTQIGIEILGSAAPGVDAEAIGLLQDYLKAVGLEGLQLLVNSVGCPKCRPGYTRALREYVHGQDGEWCQDCRTRREKNPLRLFDCKQPACRKLMARAPSIQEHLCPECRHHQQELFRRLQALNVEPRLESRLMRGLDYYSRTVFEVVSERLGAQNAVAAGGRYDGLVSALEGPDTPAVGWSLGVERLLELLPDIVPPERLDLFVVDAGPDPVRTLAQVTRLRRQGWAVEMEHESRSLKALMKRADRRGARYALLVSREDPERVEVRDMRSGEQRATTWQALAEGETKL